VKVTCNFIAGFTGFARFQGVISFTLLNPCSSNKLRTGQLLLALESGFKDGDDCAET
jgi:hypothetical protein